MVAPGRNPPGPSASGPPAEPGYLVGGPTSRQSSANEATSVAKAIGEDGVDVLRWERAQEVMNQPLREAREAFEREYLLFHLTRFGGNISRTAEFVEMDRAALHRKLKGLGVHNVLRGGKD